MTEQETISFDFAESLPITVMGERYELDLDMSAALHARIQRWFRELPDLEDAKAEAQSIEYLVGRIRGVSRETIAGWRPMIRKGILSFLSIGTIAPTPAATPPTLMT